MVSDTLTLKAETVLIGLHPTLTQFDLPDETPAYQGVGAPQALIFAPPGGSNILSGFGVLDGRDQSARRRRAVVRGGRLADR